MSSDNDTLAMLRSNHWEFSGQYNPPDWWEQTHAKFDLTQYYPCSLDYQCYEICTLSWNKCHNCEPLAPRSRPWQPRLQRNIWRSGYTKCSITHVEWLRSVLSEFTSWLITLLKNNSKRTQTLLYMVREPTTRQIATLIDSFAASFSRSNWHPIELPLYI